MIWTICEMEKLNYRNRLRVRLNYEQGYGVRPCMFLVTGAGIMAKTLTRLTNNYGLC